MSNATSTKKGWPSRRCTNRAQGCDESVRVSKTVDFVRYNAGDSDRRLAMWRKGIRIVVVIEKDEVVQGKKGCDWGYCRGVM